MLRVDYYEKGTSVSGSDRVLFANQGNETGNMVWDSGSSRHRVPVLSGDRAQESGAPTRGRHGTRESKRDSVPSLDKITCLRTRLHKCHLSLGKQEAT